MGLVDGDKEVCDLPKDTGARSHPERGSEIDKDLEPPEDAEDMLLVWFNRGDAVGSGDIEGGGFAARREDKDEFGYFREGSPLCWKIICIDTTVDG